MTHPDPFPSPDSAAKSRPATPQPGALGAGRLTLDPPPQYPGAMVNVTNR